MFLSTKFFFFFFFFCFSFSECIKFKVIQTKYWSADGHPVILSYSKRPRISTFKYFLANGPMEANF